MSNTAHLLRAARFAARKHIAQKRKGNDAAPYINHPLEVAHLLADVGNVTDHEILMAAILHDTVEDTGTTREELVEQFGERVAEMVLEVTDDKSLAKAERKQKQIEHAPHLSDGAKHIKLGDKISNIRDVLENPPDGWSDQRRLEYIDWGEKVVNGLRGANEKLENHFDELVAEARREIG